MRRSTTEREALIGKIGQEIVRFQEVSNAVDDAAAAVLAVDRRELTIISFLLFAGPHPSVVLAEALALSPTLLRDAVDRLVAAGYVAPVARGDALSLTDHARRWIETIWGPLAADSHRALSVESTHDLRAMARIMERVRPLQEGHAERIRAMLAPSTATRSARARERRGGLSPAARRRVEVFVEAHLGDALPLPELAARAGLSTFHFARAFKATLGVTPRGYVEARRVERARSLLTTSTKSIAAIAREVGLGSQSRFTSVFHRAVGQTPHALRRAHAAEASLDA